MNTHYYFSKRLCTTSHGSRIHSRRRIDLSERRGSFNNIETPSSSSTTNFHIESGGGRGKKKNSYGMFDTVSLKIKGTYTTAKVVGKNTTRMFSRSHCLTQGAQKHGITIFEFFTNDYIHRETSQVT